MLRMLPFLSLAHFVSALIGFLFNGAIASSWGDLGLAIAWGVTWLEIPEAPSKPEKKERAK